MNLNDKTALITGASRGIGRAIAQRFAAANQQCVREGFFLKLRDQAWQQKQVQSNPKKVSDDRCSVDGQFLDKLFHTDSPQSNLCLDCLKLPSVILGSICRTLALEFCERSVTRLVHEAADLIRAAGLKVGLDGFSPALTRMVGQDLGALHVRAEWTKLMTYGHTLGPAGLPFELLDLARWTMERQGAGATEVLETLSQASGLPLPTSLDDLKTKGLSPQALATEMRRGRAAGIGRLLAGVELVEIGGITRLHPQQIAADLRALRQAGADGLVLSWDLWHIPLERLELVGTIWT